MSALPPNHPKRSAAEIRAARSSAPSSVFAAASRQCRISATLYPFDEEHLDTVLQAYEDVGIRCVVPCRSRIFRA